MYQLKSDCLILQTSLLQCLLTELPIESGHCEIRGKISYACQDAYIFPGTIRQNILLGKEFVKGKYHRVLEICALEDDLAQFSSGDNVGKFLFLHFISIFIYFTHNESLNAIFNLFIYTWT